MSGACLTFKVRCSEAYIGWESSWTICTYLVVMCVSNDIGRCVLADKTIHNSVSCRPSQKQIMVFESA
jgi:hypothetical protein